MKKLMMVLAIGLALSSVGFARDRDDFDGRSGRVVERHFSGHADRNVRVDRDFRRDRDRYGFGIGFSYAPAPEYYEPDSAYYPPVVGGVVVRRDFDRDRRFDRDRDRERDRDHDRDRDDWRRFRR
jgi:hypothetical protein